MIYYFAYGSNMDREQMIERCPDSNSLGRVKLNKYHLDFRIYSPKRKCGCADIIMSNDNDNVWGVLYELSEDDLLKLDKYEGVNIGKYKRIQVSVIDDSGNNIIAKTYTVVEKSSETIKPSKDYMSQLISGAKQFLLPKEYQYFLEKIGTT